MPTTKIEDRLDNLKAYWDRCNIILNPGLSKDQIQNFEKEIEYSFENDFKGYLKKFNGFRDYVQDDDMFTFWSIDRIKEEQSDHPDEVIWFSEYFINLCNFGFHKVDNKIYTHYQGSNELMLIADNFSDFIEFYLKDSSLLLR